MRRDVIRILCTAFVLLAVGAATAVERAYALEADGDDATFDDSGPNDPWEGFNRGIFWFNEKVDIYFLGPVAVGWDFVMPDLSLIHI